MRFKKTVKLQKMKRCHLHNSVISFIDWWIMTRKCNFSNLIFENDTKRSINEIVTQEENIMKKYVKELAKSIYLLINKGNFSQCFSQCLQCNVSNFVTKLCLEKNLSNVVFILFFLAYYFYFFFLYICTLQFFIYFFSRNYACYVFLHISIFREIIFKKYKLFVFLNFIRIFLSNKVYYIFCRMICINLMQNKKRLITIITKLHRILNNYRIITNFHTQK